MTAQKFRTWASDFFACYREKIDGEMTIRKIRTMGLDAATATLESDHFLRQLPKIKRLNFSKQPIFRADSGIDLLKPGFFEEQGIYTIDDGLIYDESMSVEQAREALDDLLKEYPLDDRSKAVVITAMLTTFCAAMLPKGARPPAFIYTANSPGAGKTILVKFALIPLFGSAASRSFPRYEELRKVLDVLAIEAANYVFFDNIRSKIDGEEIESFLTASEWEARPLGLSVKYRMENITTVFFTGNQARFSDDMRDRSLFAELFVREADNRDRHFSRIIDDTFLAAPEIRTKICSALWALVKYWDGQGRPPAKSLMPRFEAWSKIAPAITSCVGYADALKKPDLTGAVGEGDDMRALVAALAPPAGSPDGPFVDYEFEDAIAKIRELGLFDEMIEEHAGRRKGLPLFDNTNVTAAGRSLFGKLLARYDKRAFKLDATATVTLSLIGRGDSRRYRFERI